jgi:hypothetical protein
MRKTGKHKFFICNLNNYRNIHYRILNEAKKLYEKFVIMLLNNIKGFKANKIEITYTFVPNSNRRLDPGNYRSIVEKFFLDALVKTNFIPDDSFQNIVKTTTIVAPIDKEAPYHFFVVETKKV